MSLSLSLGGVGPAAPSAVGGVVVGSGIASDMAIVGEGIDKGSDEEVAKTNEGYATVFPLL